MVSDTSLDELHVFARELGIPPRGFHGDHYDLTANKRLWAMRMGAIEVTNRQLVELRKKREAAAAAKEK